MDNEQRRKYHSHRGGGLMNIKTFPLQFTKEKLDEIKEVADKLDESKKEFILKSIEQRLKEEK